MLRPEDHVLSHRHAASRRAVAGARAAAAQRMPVRQRSAIYLIMGALWLSGCLWLLLDQFFATQGQFGRTPHAWQPPLLLIHGIMSIAAMYLLGWVSARHVLRWWPGRLRRLSGGTLSVCLVLLAATGFALFFVSDDRWQQAAAVSHDVLGVAVTVFGIQHWFFARRRVMRSAASRPW
jgi:hypothetical protein